jgi:hypothetical protein
MRLAGPKSGSLADRCVRRTWRRRWGSLMVSLRVGRRSRAGPFSRRGNLGRGAWQDHGSRALRTSHDQTIGGAGGSLHQLANEEEHRTWIAAPIAVDADLQRLSRCFWSAESGNAFVGVLIRPHVGQSIHACRRAGISAGPSGGFMDVMLRAGRPAA